MSKGSTLSELVIVLTVATLVLVLGARGWHSLADRLAVAEAANEIVAAHRQSRTVATFSGRRVRLEVSADSIVGFVESGAGDSVFWRRPGPSMRGIQMTPSRPVIRFLGNGVGLGAANTTMTLTRRSASVTLVTSRLGRLRRSP